MVWTCTSHWREASGITVNNCQWTWKTLIFTLRSSLFFLLLVIISPWITVSELGRLWSSHCALPCSSCSSSSSMLSEFFWGPVSAAELASSSAWKHLSVCPRRWSSSFDLQWAEWAPSTDGDSALCMWDLEARCFLRNLARRFLNQTCTSGTEQY